MKKKLTLLILLLPFVAFTQTTVSPNGTISIDFGKKKSQPAPTETPKTETPKEEKTLYQSDLDSIEEAENAKPARQRKAERKASKPDNAKDDFDFKKDGLFKGLFHAGINACQIDGDNEYGYKYLGANVGVGVQVRFHKIVSISMSIDYAMKGAKARIVPLPDSNSRQLYQVQVDYIEVPIGINIQDKKLVMASFGIAPAVLVRFKERNYVGQDVTDHPSYGGFPHKFDLNGFIGFGFIIKQNFYLGGKFEYSFLKMRPAYAGTRANGQYNNVLTFSFMYILNRIKKKS